MKVSDWQRYQILSTYDGQTILRQLGERYRDLGEIHKAATEAYARLTSEQKAMDYWQASQELEAIAQSPQPCPNCGTVGDHYCPADLCRADD